LPPNLRSAHEQIEANDVREFVTEEGIPLYLIPGAAIGVELLAAGGHAARRTVLGRRYEAILNDCEGVLQSCDNPVWADQVPFLLDGIGCARAGFTRPAQALFASVLETLVNRYFPDSPTRRAVLSHPMNGGARRKSPTSR